MAIIFSFASCSFDISGSWEGTDGENLGASNIVVPGSSLAEKIGWLWENARSGGSYIIVLGRDEAAPYITLSFNNMQVSVTLKASGGERKVRYEGARPSYSLFTVGSGVTFTLEDGVVLTGLQSNSKPLVRVAGGTFIMNGGSIKDNRVTSGNSEDGGGVRLESGTFTMNNGTISGNGTSYAGGGVCVAQGTFTMYNGAISGNTAGNENSGGGGGGGVYVGGGAFTMNGGDISGNTGYVGGGVYVAHSATFTKSGANGIIYGSNAPDMQANRARSRGAAVYSSNGRRDTTARVSQAMDSRQSGAAGGWE